MISQSKVAAGVTSSFSTALTSPFVAAKTSIENGTPSILATCNVDTGAELAPFARCGAVTFSMWRKNNRFGWRASKMGAEGRVNQPIMAAAMKRSTTAIRKSPLIPCRCA